MYGPDLDELIEAATEDGVITETERRVLERKALKMGCDLDELNVILEARLHKKRREFAQKTPPPPPPVSEPVNRSTNINYVPDESIKMGKIKRCAACNAIIPPGSVRCPDCGLEFRNIEAVNSMRALQARLDALSHNSKGGVGAEIFSQLGLSSTDSRQARIIRDFPVPNAREDLMEFMIAMKNRGDKDYRNMPSTVKGACYLKYMECYDKAKLFFADDPQFQPLIAEAKKIKTNLSRGETTAIYAGIGLIVFCFIIYFLIS